MTDEVWGIFEEAFEPALRRSRQGQTALLAHKNYNFDVYKTSGGEAQAFLAWWDFGDFAFGEHLAVKKNLRGQGVGCGIVKDLLSKNNTLVIEVEQPDNEINKRRIAFYERNGLILHDFRYFQPPYSADGAAVPLKIMASRELSKEEFTEFCDKIFCEVYKMDTSARKKIYCEV